MSEENIGGEDSIIDERRKKLEILRKKILLRRWEEVSI